MLHNDVLVSIQVFRAAEHAATQEVGSDDDMRGRSARILSDLARGINAQVAAMI